MASEKLKEIEKKFFITNQKNYPLLPFKISKDCFTTIDAKAGDIIFFEPSILHQGNCNSSRLQFHMRYENVENLKSQNIDYIYNKNLSINTIKEYNIDINVKNNNLNFPRASRSPFYKRLLYSINYYLPILNFLKYIKLKKSYKNKELNFDLFSNTFFSKII